MRRYFRLEKTHGLRAPCLAEIVQRKARTLSRMHRRVALHVGEGEVGFAISPVRRAEQGKERSVLREGQDLPIAERPTLGREVEREDPDLGHERVHAVLLRSGSGKSRTAK